MTESEERICQWHPMSARLNLNIKRRAHDHNDRWCISPAYCKTNCQTVQNTGQGHPRRQTLLPNILCGVEMEAVYDNTRRKDLRSDKTVTDGLQIMS